MSKLKEFFTKHDLVHKLIAILMAIALWFIVVANNDDLMRTNTIANIPITYTNEDVLEDDYGLRLIEGQDQTVTVKLTGPYASLYSLTTNDIQVRVNLANFQKPGTYTINTSSQSTNCTLVVNSSSVTAEVSTPSSFQIVLDEVITKEVPVTIQVDGTPSAGYMYDDPEGEQAAVNVTGPKTVVNQIRKATAVVPAEDSTGLTKTTSVLASFTFLDEKNQPVDQTHLTSEPNDYSVTIPVYAVAKLPLTINLISSDTVDKNSVKATIDPQEITVYGTEEVISKLTAINLGDLQLSTVSLDEDAEPITIPIELPTGVTRVQGEATSAKVTIQAVGMSTREMPVTKITLQNSGSDPNLTATLRTTSVNVRIQAETAALANLTADAFQVIAVFNADELGPGIHEVPIEVQCEQLESANASFTLLNPDEKVTIEIQQTGESENTTPTEENETT